MLKAAYVVDNPYLSALLSRANVDPYTRWQRPLDLPHTDSTGRKGDVMAEFLGKERGTPWYVVPILVPMESEEATILDGKLRSPRKGCAGYLTLDHSLDLNQEEPAGGQQPLSSWPDSPIQPEYESSLQRDIMHFIDVGAALMAMNRDFRRYRAGPGTEYAQYAARLTRG